MGLYKVEDAEGSGAEELKLRGSETRDRPHINLQAVPSTASSMCG